MLVILHNTLDRLEGNVDNVLDVVKAFVSLGRSSRLLEVEAKVIDGPFRSVLRIIIFRTLLNRHIRQVNLHIIEIILRHSVLGGAESCEALG